MNTLEAGEFLLANPTWIPPCKECIRIKINDDARRVSALSASTAFAQDGNSRLQVTMDKPVGLMVDGHMQEVHINP